MGINKEDAEALRVAVRFWGEGGNDRESTAIRLHRVINSHAAGGEIKPSALGEIVEPRVAAAFAQQTESANHPGWRTETPASRALHEAGERAKLIGTPGWQKGVLDCIDLLHAQLQNVHSSLSANPDHGTNRGVDFIDAIHLLRKLYEREVKS